MIDFQTVIFDFDGVIVDSEQEKFASLNNILKEKGLPELSCNLIDIIGKKTNLILKENFPEMSKNKIEEITKERRKMLRQNLNLPLVNGIKKLLELLKKDAYTIALTSGTQEEIARKILKKYDLEKYFIIFVFGDEFKSSKPDPECYLLTMKKLMLKPENVIVVEDSPAGILAAKNAGLRVVALGTYYDKKDLKDADYYCKNLSDLIDRLFMTGP